MNKKRMIKLAALVTAIGIGAGVFAGCGTQNSQKTDDGRTILSIEGYPEKDGPEKDRVDAKYAKFEAENPDVKIEPTSWKFDLKTFFAKAAGGQLPTLFATNYTELDQCVSANYIADLTDVLKKRGYEGMFNKAVLDVVSRDGKQYAFPTAAYLFGVSFNTEMFEKAGLMAEDGTPKQPKTWEELRDFAVKIKEKTGKPGFALPTSNNYGGWMFMPIAWSYGTEFMKQDSSGKWKATFNTPECAAALQYVKDLKWKYDVLPANTLIDGPEYSKLMGTGSVGMVIGTPGAKDYATYGMDPQLYGMMAIPAGPKRHVTLLGGVLSCVSGKASPEQIDAAVRYIEMNNTFKVTDTVKKSKEDDIKTLQEANAAIGVKSMSVWSEESDVVKFENELIEKNANINLNHVKLYNDFVANVPCEIQAEEPVSCQQLYAILDKCIQQVLTDKNADCAAILERANSDFQVDYLDQMD